MKVSRRKFLAATPLAFGAMLPVNGSAFGKTASILGFRNGGGDQLALLAWDSFFPYVTTNFTFRDPDGRTVELLLTQMNDTRPGGYKTRGDGDECFALVFSGPPRRPLKQGTYSVEHFALGSFTLFITELGIKNKRKHYEVIINRITG